MASERRKIDENNERIVAEFLKKEFYDKYTTNYRHCDTKSEQVSGIDTIFDIGDKHYECDEKAATSYINKGLNTFILELSFLDRYERRRTGWFLDSTKINNSYLFVWIDNAKNDILESVDDILDCEIALVKKDAIWNYFNSIGLTNEMIENKVDEILTYDNFNNRLKGVKFCYSDRLFEKPINIILKRSEYIAISDFHVRITIEDK